MPNEQRRTDADPAEAQHQQRKVTRPDAQKDGPPAWQELVHHLLQAQLREFHREAERIMRRESQ